MTQEQKARVSIDALLQQAGWHVCNVSNANIYAATGVAIHERKEGIDDQFHRRKALWLATLANGFAAT